MYMSLLDKSTDQDLDTYPHVLLTGLHEWDPSVLNDTHPQEKMIKLLCQTYQENPKFMFHQLCHNTY